MAQPLTPTPDFNELTKIPEGDQKKLLEKLLRYLEDLKRDIERKL